MLFCSLKKGAYQKKLYVVFCHWKQQVCCCWSCLFFFFFWVVVLLLFSVVVFLLFVFCFCFFKVLLLLFVCFCDLLDFVIETDPDFLGRLHACTVTINRPVSHRRLRMNYPHRPTALMYHRLLKARAAVSHPSRNNHWTHSGAAMFALAQTAARARDFRAARANGRHASPVLTARFRDEPLVPGSNRQVIYIK